MTDTPTSPPAGWYPATDGSGATWWWDGQRWAEPPAQLQPRQPPAPSPATISGIAKVATATQVLLLVYGLTSLLTIGVELFGITAVTAFLNGQTLSTDMLDTYDQSSSVITILSVIVLIAAGVLWVIWQYRAAKTVIGLTRRTPGWHAGSWFIPIVSLWFPYQNISDLWRAVGRARPSWLGIWWFLWLASNLVIQLSTRVYLAAEELEQYRLAMGLSIAGEIFLLAAVPLAWLVVRGITQGVAQRTAAPEQSPAV